MRVIEDHRTIIVEQRRTISLHSPTRSHFDCTRNAAMFRRNQPLRDHPPPILWPGNNDMIEQRKARLKPFGAVTRSVGDMDHRRRPPWQSFEQGRAAFGGQDRVMAADVSAPKYQPRYFAYALKTGQFHQPYWQRHDYDVQPLRTKPLHQYCQCICILCAGDISRNLDTRTRSKRCCNWRDVERLMHSADKKDGHAHSVILHRQTLQHVCRTTRAKS